MWFSRPLILALVALAVATGGVLAQPARRLSATVLGPTAAAQHASPGASQAIDTAALKPMVRVVLQPEQGKLADLLKKEAAKAFASGRIPFIELGGPGCGVCETLNKSLSDERMRDAFQGTYIIDIGGEEFSEERWNPWWAQQERLLFRPGGIHVVHFPAFFELGSAGVPTGQRVDAAAFINFNEDTTLDGMPGPLKKFFRRTIAAAVRRSAPPPVQPMVRIELQPEPGKKLADLLKQEAAKAFASGRTPFVLFDQSSGQLPQYCYLTCGAFRVPLHDTQVIDALKGTYIISVDLKQWVHHTDEDLDAFFGNPYTIPALPVFLELDRTGTLTGQRVDALAFDSATPAGMARPLQRFFSKHLRTP